MRSFICNTAEKTRRSNNKIALHIHLFIKGILSNWMQRMVLFFCRRVSFKSEFVQRVQFGLCIICFFWSHVNANAILTSTFVRKFFDVCCRCLTIGLIYIFRSFFWSWTYAIKRYNIWFMSPFDEVDEMTSFQVALNKLH